MTTSLARLSDLLASVRHGVGAITQASEQIAAGNGDLRTRSRRSADGLDGLVAAVTRYTEQLQTCSQSVEAVVTTVQALRLDAARNRRQVQRLQARRQCRGLVQHRDDDAQRGSHAAGTRVSSCQASARWLKPEAMVGLITAK